MSGTSRRRGLPPPLTSSSPIKFELADEDDIDDETAQLLTPQVTIDVAQGLAPRRKSYMEHRQFVNTDDNTYIDECYEDDYDNEIHDYYDPRAAGHNINFGFTRPRTPASPRQRSDAKRPATSMYSPQAGSGVSSNSASKSKKMYELDVRLFPEAAAAKASYENRLRKKAEREQMIREIDFLRERNRVLEEENQVLKDKLQEYEMNVTAQDWYLFFRSAGIRSGDDRKYAAIFDSNRIKPSMLLDLNEQWLRDMEIAAVGDILSILKHAKMVHAKTNGRKLHFQSPPLTPRAGLPQLKKATTLSGSTNDNQIINKNGITISSVRPKDDSLHH